MLMIQQVELSATAAPAAVLLAKCHEPAAETSRQYCLSDAEIYCNSTGRQACMGLPVGVIALYGTWKHAGHCCHHWHVQLFCCLRQWQLQANPDLLHASLLCSLWASTYTVVHGVNLCFYFDRSVPQPSNMTHFTGFQAFTCFMFHMIFRSLSGAAIMRHHKNCCCA